MSLQRTKLRQLLSFSNVMRRLLLSWMLAVTLEYLLLPGALRKLADLQGLSQMSFGRAVGVSCGIFIIFSAGDRLTRLTKVQRWLLPAVFGGLSLMALLASFSWPFFTVSLLLFLALSVFAVFGWDSRPEPVAAMPKSSKVWPWVTAVLCAAFFGFVCAWTVGRVYSFSTPTYDFGIFSQMFYHMKEYGVPFTTVERDGLLSHFAVHVSPIYYLLLPFYYLAPTPATLQVLQAAVITSAVIPL